MNRATAGSSSGNITHASTGAVTKNVALSGTASNTSWVAYNDCAGTNSITNTTNIKGITGTGSLKNFDTGTTLTGIVATFTSSGSPTEATSNGAAANSGTDAYNTFNGKADMVGVVNYGSSSGWYIDLTITGLDPSKTYTFATSANRNDSTYTTRISRYTISDIDAASNASTSGVTVISNESLSFVTGYNTVNGYVARWTGVQPGSDGDFKVRADYPSNYQAYGFSVFMLAEELNASPTITTTGTLSAFSTPVGTPSEAQSYSVAGTSLTDAIVITPPSGFEISLSETSGFASSAITLTPTSGTVATTPIWVRLSGASEGSFSGDITHTSTGAASKNVAVSGSVIQYYTLTVNVGEHGSVVLNPPGGNYASGTVVNLTANADSGYAFSAWSGDLVSSDNPANITMNGNKTVNATFAAAGCTTVNLPVVADTYMNSGNTKGNYNYGGAPTVQLNPYYQQGGSDQYRAPLLRWDVSSIPPTATVTDASLSFYVTTGQTAYTYNLYNLRRAWIEGTSNDASSTTSVTWNKYDGVNNWGTAGAANTTSDRYADNLWNAVATDFGGTGHQTFTLNSLGVAVVQGWITGSLNNYGLTIQNYSGTSTGSWIAASRENTSGYAAPTLNVTYCASATPVISTTGTLAPFTTLPGVPSDAQTYSVSGTNLEGNIHIQAPAGFVISTHDSIYSSSLDLIPTAGSVALTTIYVRLSSATAGSFSGNIVHTSTNATSKNIAVEGTVSDQVCYDVSLAAIEDNYLSAANVQYNNGGSTSVRVDNTTGTSRRTGLFKWDVSSIPSTATIQSASLKLNVTESSSLVFNLYNMRQAWVEGTSDRVNSTTSSNWNTYDGVNSWGTVGAANIDIDRFDDNLWSAGTSSFTSTGSKTLPLNSAGVGVIQGWVNASLPNYGFIMQNYSGTTADAVQFSSSEDTTAANRPTLLVNYCVGGAETYALTVGTDSHGSVTLDPSGGSYPLNQVVTLTPVPASGYAFSHWSGADAGDIINTAGVYTIVMNADKSIFANFGRAPGAPVLVVPADGATGVLTPPTLEVTVTDPDGDPMSVSFYGRPVSSTAAEDFMLITIPDTQNLATSYATTMSNMFAWIADRYADTSGADLEFVTHVGDIVNTASSTTEWNNAVTAFAQLETDNVPYSVGPGNHDVGGLYSTYFGHSRFDGKSWYQGYYTSGNDNYNNYSFFSAGGMDFILINLEYNAGTGPIGWADGLLKANPTKRGIVVQHDVLNLDNSYQNSTTFNELKDNPNLFLMLCGHMHSASDGSAYRLETRSGMDPVHVLLTDFQDYTNTDYLRLLTFKPASDEIYAQVCSPVKPGTCLTNASNYEQFTMAYDMDGTAPASYTLIGTVNGIASGGNASISWTGLSENQEYEWYAVASDGHFSTDSPAWTFTTAGATGNQAPVLGAIGGKSVAEMVQLSFTANATDDGLPSGTLTYSLAAGTSGTIPTGAEITTGGAFTWTPTEAQGPGSYTFDVCVSDGELNDCETITVTVSEVNVAPVLAAIGAKSIAELVQLSFTASATDADLPANPLTYSLAAGTSGSVPPGAGITAGGAFTWTPTEAQGPGSSTFDVCVSDGALSDCETITVTVSEVNVAPVLAAIGNKSVVELVQLSFTASATDADLPANPLTYSLAAGTSGTVPPGAGITAGGAFTWTPTEAQGPGSYTFDVCVSDGSISDCETITVTVSEVNVAPVLGAIGNKSVAELVQLSFTASATDDGLPSGTLTYTLAAGTSGTVPISAAIDPATGAFTWTPTEAQGPGSYTFDVCVSDGALSDCETITVTVSEVNAAPVLAAIGDKSIAELVQLSFSASATDGDVPANSLTFSLTGTVPPGAGITTAGAFTWTPTEAQGPGSYPFDMCVSDGALSDCETITVTVSEVNAAPVLAAIGNKSVAELVPLSFTASATDGDVPVNTLAYSLVDAPVGASINTTSGLFGWIPSEEQGPGVYPVTVKVCDNGSPAACDEEVINITVTEVNQTPAIVEVGNKSVNELETLSFTVNVLDLDLPANALSFSLIGAPTGATIGSTSGVFNWMPGEAQGPGLYTFTLKVCDNGLPSFCDEETIKVTVAEINSAPQLDPIGNRTAPEMAAFTFTATTSDPDIPANALTYSLAGTVPPGAGITTAGAFTWTPTEAQGPGSFTFDVCVSDGALSDCETITVTVSEVNVAPVLAAIGSKSVAELAQLSFSASATDVDVPANPLTYSLAGTVPTGAGITVGGAFTWTPTEAQGPGSYTFDVCVSDGALSDCETITVTVSEVNVAPVLAAIGNKTVAELVQLSFSASATDGDVPANTLTYSLAGTVPTGAGITVGGAFTWTPTEAQGPGPYTFDVCVSDGALSDCETITVSVSEVNVAPVLATIGAKTIQMYVELTFTAMATDADIPANSLIYSLQNGAAGLVPAGAAISAEGVFSWTPGPSQGPATHTFDVCVSDGALSDCETITVEVIRNTNDPPVITETDPVAVTMSEDGSPIAFALTLHATDPDVGATLTWSIKTAAQHGLATASGTGLSREIGYTPSANYNGNDSFVVQVSDGSLTDSITVNVVIEPVNDAPVADAQSATIHEDEAVLLKLTGSDLEGSPLTFVIVTDPAHGTLSGVAPDLTYTPASTYNGPDSFTFKVNDGAADSVPATVSILVKDPTPWMYEKLTTSKVVFNWKDIDGATKYKIQLSTKADFSKLIFSVKTVESKYPYPTALKYSKTYYWRVSAKVNGFWQDWTTYTFYSMDPLTAPVLRTPLHKAPVDTHTPEFTWDAVKNGVAYKIKINNVSNFATIIESAKITSTAELLSYLAKNLPNGKYYWKVRAIDASGGKGPWSEVRIVKVVAP